MASRTCPICAESIPLETGVCPFCDEPQTAAARREQRAQAQVDAPLYWVGDKLHVALRGRRPRAFPADRCVRCGQPASGRSLSLTLAWHPTWIYLLVVVNVLVYALAALMTQRKALLDVGLCRACRGHRGQGITMAWAIGLAGLCGVVYGVSQLRANEVHIWLVVLGFLTLIAGAVIGARAAGVVSAVEITPHHVLLRRVHPSFLDDEL